MSLPLLVTSILVAAASLPSRPDAAAELVELQNAMRKAHAAGDERTALQAALEMQELLNDTSAALEESARAHARAGDPQKALAALDRLAAIGVSTHLPLSGEKSPWAALAALPGYRAAVGRLDQNARALSTSETVFTLADAGLLAEDVDYDARSRSFFLTSVRERKIVRLDASGAIFDFAASPSRWPLLAIKIDAKGGFVWATEVALRGFASIPEDQWGRSAVLCFDLASGRLLRRIEGPPLSALGDMVLDARGDPIVSDSDGGGIYAVSGGAIRRLDKGDFVSPQTPTLHPDGKHLWVPDYARGIGLLDLTTGQVVWLNHHASPQFAFDGIDGLYHAKGSLIVTQNGTSPERVARFLLDPTLGRIVSQEIIEQSTATLGEPTHGVVVGDFFYYIANSGWNGIDERGEPKKGVSPTPARLMRHRL